jgi:hypothetical protein
VRGRVFGVLLRLGAQSLLRDFDRAGGDCGVGAGRGRVGPRAGLARGLTGERRQEQKGDGEG